jgi:hypothetical protein
MSCACRDLPNRFGVPSGLIHEWLVQYEDTQPTPEKGGREELRLEAMRVFSELAMLIGTCINGATTTLFAEFHEVCP